MVPRSFLPSVVLPRPYRLRLSLTGGRPPERNPRSQPLVRVREIEPLVVVLHPGDRGTADRPLSRSTTTGFLRASFHRLIFTYGKTTGEEPSSAATLLWVKGARTSGGLLSLSLIEAFISSAPVVLTPRSEPCAEGLCPWLGLARTCYNFPLSLFISMIHGCRRPRGAT